MQCDRQANSDPLPPECSADVDHVEVRHEAGQTQCQLNAPTGMLFGAVLLTGSRGALASGSSTREVERIRFITQQEPSNPIILACEVGPTGLIPFQPPVTCANCEDANNGAFGVLFIFKNGYFGSMVSLKYDFTEHRILLNEEKVRSAIPLGTSRYGLPELERQTSSSTAGAEAVLNLYPEHADTAPFVPVKLSKGDKVDLLQSWAPVTMEPVDTRLSPFQTVSYDENNAWLQINLNGQTGWIRGDANFSAIGLPLPSADR
jgi:hypothetical protein